MQTRRAGLLVAVAIVVTSCVAPGTEGAPLNHPTSLPPVTTLPPATTTTTLGVPAGPVLEEGSTVCDLYDPVVEQLGDVASADVVEASGIVASRTNDGAFWIINDSGNDSVLHAVDAAGSELAALELPGVIGFDWEDIAVGPGPVAGTSYVYIGDIGDNLRLRSTINLIRFPEPDLSDRPTAITETDILRLSYPDGAEDSEALWVDPITGDVFVVTKRQDDGRAVVYRTPAALLTGAEPAPMTAIAEFRFPDRVFVTAADVTSDGAVLALRGYNEVWMWVRTDLGYETTLANEPCLAPSPDEVQGEALAFVPGSLAYVTVSEGTSKPLNLVTPAAP